jgi:agmatinase
MAGTPTYAVPSPFLGITRSDPDADFVIAGIPIDIGTTNRSGTREGPAAIRRASRMLTDGAHPEHWVEAARMNLSASAASPLPAGGWARPGRLAAISPRPRRLAI